MQPLIKLFTEHPHATGETYAQHLRFTLRIALRLLFCGFILIIHGLFPFLFTRTTSKRVEVIYAIMKTRIPKELGQSGDGI